LLRRSCRLPPARRAPGCGPRAGAAPAKEINSFFGTFSASAQAAFPTAIAEPALLLSLRKTIQLPQG
jgi:hypothetical protein